MTIISTGPIVGTRPLARLIIVVEDDSGARIRFRLFQDFCESLTREQFTKAIRGVIEHRREMPAPSIHQMKGAVI